MTPAQGNSEDYGFNDGTVWVLKHHQNVLQDTWQEARCYGETLAVANALARCFNTEGRDIGPIERFVACFAIEQARSTAVRL